MEASELFRHVQLKYQSASYSSPIIFSSMSACCQILEVIALVQRCGEFFRCELHAYYREVHSGGDGWR